MKDRFNKHYPAEEAFLTNPIVSTTEATGCALHIEKREGETMSLSAPCKATKLPGKDPEKIPET